MLKVIFNLLYEPEKHQWCICQQIWSFMSLDSTQDVMHYQNTFEIAVVNVSSSEGAHTREYFYTLKVHTLMNIHTP